MADKVITSTTPCDCCGGGTDPCPALLIGIGFDEVTENPINVPYSSLGLAEDAMMYMVANCLAFNRHPSIIPNSFSATIASSTLLQLAMNITDGNAGIWFAVSFSTAADISIAWTLLSDAGGSESANVQFYDFATGAYVTSNAALGTSGTLSVLSLPAGCYIVNVNAGGPGTYAIANFDFSSDVAMDVKPVIATWDDGGTIAYLNCCPDCYKITVPPGEVSAFEAAYIRDNYVFLAPPTIGSEWDTFTASGIGGPFSASAALANQMDAVFRLYLELPVGTMTINYTLSGTTGAGANTHNILAELLPCFADSTVNSDSSYDGTAGLTSTGSLTISVAVAGRYLLKITTYNASSAPPDSLGTEIDVDMAGMANLGFCVVEGGGGPGP